MCPALQAHFLKVLQPVCCNTRTKVQLIEAVVLYELRNLISRNEMSWFCCLHGKITRYSELHIFRWVLLSKDKVCHTLQSLLLNHHTIFLEWGVVHQAARERYMYQAKEYSQTAFVRLEPRKIPQPFTVIVMVAHIVSVCCVHVHSVKCFQKSKCFFVSSSLATHSNKLSSNSKLLHLNVLKTAINFMPITFSVSQQLIAVTRARVWTLTCLICCIEVPHLSALLVPAVNGTQKLCKDCIILCSGLYDLNYN